MAQFDLPRSLSKKNMAILEFMDKHDGPINGPFLDANMDGEHDKASKSMSAMKYKGLVKAVSGGMIITPKGRFFVKNKAKIDLRVPKTYNTGRKKEASQSPAPPPLNISAAATNVVDHISALVHQNAALLAKITEVRDSLNSLLGEITDGPSQD